MAAAALSDVLSSRQFYRKNPGVTSVNSIEQDTSADNNDPNRGLPEQVASLNQGGDYWRTAKGNRYRKLIREGHLNDLLELAELAPKMAKRSDPAHWFASVASKANWERTLKFLAKLREVARMAEDAAKRVQARAQDMGAVLKAVWRHGERAVQMAVTASETAVTKKRPEGSAFKLFCHLALKQGNNPITA